MQYSIMTLAALPVGPAAQDVSLAEVYRQIRDGGAEFIDPGTIDLQFGGLSAVKAAMAETGLKAGCFLCFVHAPQMTDDGVRAAIEEGCRGVEDTLALGAKIMMYVPFGYDREIQGYSREAIAEKLYACLKPVVDYAEAKNVSVVVEDDPHRGIPMCAAEEMQALFAAVPKAKLVYDSGNMVCCGEDPIAYYDMFADRTVHAHIKELFGGEERMDGGSVGEGDIDFPTLFAHMRCNGYSGLLAIETLERRLGITAAVRKAIRYLDSI